MRNRTETVVNKKNKSLTRHTPESLEYLTTTYNPSTLQCAGGGRAGRISWRPLSRIILGKVSPAAFYT